MMRATLRALRTGIAWTEAGGRPARQLVSFLDIAGLTSRALLATADALPCPGVGLLLDPFDMTMLGTRAARDDRASDEPERRRLSSRASAEIDRPASRAAPALRPIAPARRARRTGEHDDRSQLSRTAWSASVLTPREGRGLALVGPLEKSVMPAVSVGPDQLAAILSRFDPGEHPRPAPTVGWARTAARSEPGRHEPGPVTDAFVAALRRAENTLESWTRSAMLPGPALDGARVDESRSEGPSSEHDDDRPAPHRFADARHGTRGERRAVSRERGRAPRAADEPRGRAIDGTHVPTHPRRADEGANAAPARPATALDRITTGSNPSVRSGEHSSIDLAAKVDAALRRTNPGHGARSDEPSRDSAETLHFIGAGFEAVQARLAELDAASTTRPPVEWLDDDGDLAGRLHRILSRQALRRGIDLS